MKYKAIIFDLDGTLLDSVATIVLVTRQTLQSMGFDADEKALRHAIGVPLTVQAEWFAPGRQQEFVTSYRKTYIKHGGHDSKPFPGTLEMLTNLRKRGHATAIVTSKNAVGTKKAIDMNGMDSLFDCVITADDVICYKPHPEPVIKAMAELGVTPDESLYVGDSTFDFDMANTAGMSVVGMSWGARTRDELVDGFPKRVVVDNWAEFLRWLNKPGSEQL